MLTAKSDPGPYTPTGAISGLLTLLFGIGFLIIALALGYYLIKQNRPAADS
jgi:uncharacterized membrane protein YciS (DUF1049 family)